VLVQEVAGEVANKSDNTFFNISGSCYGGSSLRQHISYFLDEIVDTHVLQEIQDKFSEVTGLAAVVVDPDGKPVTNPSNFTNFCLYMRSDPDGFALCSACDDRAGRAAMEIQRPFIHRCHSGLTDLAAPIIVNNEYLGALLAGQVILNQDHNEKRQMTCQVASSTIDPEKLSQYFDMIKVVPENKVKAAAELIYIMANYIVEMGVANIGQKQLMAEMKAKADLENMLRATELRALQSQINPHFLFNTLNTIARLALLEGANRTQELVYALSDLLRNNLKDIDELRPLEEELKSVTDYLMIQKARFGSRIQAFIDIDQQLMDVALPALSLQPLVENAIIHGIEPQKNGGDIRISGCIDGERVVITVSDTGIGISPERLRKMYIIENRKTTKGQSTGLGFINVHKRLQHYFGSQFGLHIESTLGKGTDVYLYVPR
jgi:LytS/YehU family sensor histidine kinase